MSPLQEKPVIHGRDHSHGGADPTMIAYEDVGGPGSGGGIQFDILNVGGFLQIEASGSVTLDAADFLFSGAAVDADFVANMGGNILLNAAGGAIQIAMQPTVGIQLYTTAGPVIVPVGDFRVPSLPTADPGQPGRFWNNSGVVRVSP